MKTRLITAALAAFLLLPFMATAAYAGGGSGGDYYACEEAVAVLVEDVTDDPGPLVREENPFTPHGTGTVLDNATDEDGKEFYTIVTPDENVFYLIIDKQRQTENVYFLNAVTEADLLSLAVTSDVAEPEPVPVVVQEPDPEPEEEPEPEPEPAKKGGAGSFLLVLLIVAAGGGAGYYFKIYRPKQEGGAGAGDDDEYEADPYDDYAEDDYGAEPEDEGAYDYDESEGGEE